MSEQKSNLHLWIFSAIVLIVGLILLFSYVKHENKVKTELQEQIRISEINRKQERIAEAKKEQERIQKQLQERERKKKERQEIEKERQQKEQQQFLENINNILKVNVYNTGGLMLGKTYIKVKNNSNYLLDNLTYHIVFYGSSGNIKEEIKERFTNLKPYEERIVHLKHVNYGSVKYECILLKCDAVQVDWKK